MKKSPEQQRLIRIEDKVDKAFEHISGIDTTLAGQHESLKEHIRRTDLLESRIEPIEKSLHMFIGAFKFITVIIGIVGFLSSIAEILSYLRR